MKLNKERRELMRGRQPISTSVYIDEQILGLATKHLCTENKNISNVIENYFIESLKSLGVDVNPQATYLRSVEKILLQNNINVDSDNIENGYLVIEGNMDLKVECYQRYSKIIWKIRSRSKKVEERVRKFISVNGLDTVGYRCDITSFSSLTLILKLYEVPTSQLPAPMDIVNDLIVLLNAKDKF